MNNYLISYSGNSPGGTTILTTSLIKENFMIRSADVVADSDGEALTYYDMERI